MTMGQRLGLVAALLPSLVMGASLDDARLQGLSERVGASVSANAGERLSLNVHEMEVRAVLASLAEFTGLNLVVADGVSGLVTLNLNDVPWEQALGLILQSQGLASHRDGNVLFVAPAETFEAPLTLEASPPPVLESEHLAIRYARATDLAELLRRDGGFGLLTDDGRVAVDERTNALWVQDTPEQLAEIRRMLARLDVPVRQVQIEARIVVARDSASRALGINWGVSSTRGFQELDNGTFGPRDINPSGLNRARGGLTIDLGAPGRRGAGTGFTFGYLAGDVLLDLELRALETEGMSQTISQPRIITANQRTARILQGQERAFTSGQNQENPQIEFKEAVLSLEVTPQITPDDRIVMNLLITNDTFGQPEAPNFEPPINRNEIETQVLVDDGQTVVLGGILTSEELRQLAQTPLLGDLPVIGRLFRYTEESNEKVELLVFITPRLLDDGLAVR